MRTLSNVRWSDLRPDDFLRRQSACPIVYMPIGLCEPHGHVAALGLDTLKADYYCEEAAERFGGIVAPTQGYHIHECGFHKPWLDEVVGDTNPLLAGMPPRVVCYHFLYQLRAFANAGFHAVIVVSGHAGGSQKDLRRVAKAFTKSTGIPVAVKTDPEWGGYEGDHAGAYEISQLQAIHITDNLWDYAYHIRLRGRSCKQKNRIRLYGKSQIMRVGHTTLGCLFSPHPRCGADEPDDG